jgi:RecA/RadA recombinase
MSIIDNIVKKFNNEDVIKFSDKDGFKEVNSWAYTGSPTLDYNLHTFGLPTGIIEIAGKSRSGKTTLGLMSMKYFMKENKDNGIPVILSSENRDNKDYALQLGLDVNKIIIIRIRYVEKMFMMVKNLLTETDELFADKHLGKPKFFFLWDSIGATLSKSELDTMEENTEILSKKFDNGTDISDLKHEKVGAFAKSAKMFAKFMMGEMYTRDIHFIMLNHQYETIGGFGPSVRKSTGGEWVELLPCLRLSMRLKGYEKVDDEEVSQLTEVKVVKNDFGSRIKTTIRILLGYGIILSDEDIEYAVKKGILQKEGARKITFLNGKISWKSPRELFALYKKHNKYLDVLNIKIKNSRQKDLLDLKNSYLDEDEDEE